MQYAVSKHIQGQMRQLPGSDADVDSCIQAATSSLQGPSPAPETAATRSLEDSPEERESSWNFPECVAEGLPF